MSSTTLSVSDLVKIHGTNTPLTAQLTYNGSPLVGKPVKFNIHGVDYTRTTDSSGYASLNINLGVGAYTTKVIFDGDASYEAVTRTVMVRVVDKPKINLIVGNLTKIYGTDTPLTAKIDIPSIITGLTVYFTIHGVEYKRLTDVNGEAKLNINLGPGVYSCQVRYSGDNTYSETIKNVTVTVKADTWIDGVNLTKYVGDATPYQCAVYDQWNRLNPCTVDLKINGVWYTRSSGADGLIKLNINLQPGEYPIQVRFNGDDTHNPSSRSTDLVVVKPRIEELNKRSSDGLVSPLYNQGHVETHIYHLTYSIDDTKKASPYFTPGNWNKAIENGWEINFTNYEITETDPRVKTAKFTTDTYFDLTAGQRWVYIVSPYHENFGGRILKVDYDKSTGLYTYQCQDGRRNYLSKRVNKTSENTSTTVYQVLEGLLVSPRASTKGAYSIPLNQEWRNAGAKELSGLHPIDDYDNLKGGATKFDNKFKEPAPASLSYDATIDKIMNFSHIGGFPTDVYFDTMGVCHIDPVDLDKWLNSGICVTHQDLISYKYGFDTTNIVTGISLQTPTRESSLKYDEFRELGVYFGMNVGMISPVNTTTTDTSSSSSSSSAPGKFKGKTVVVGCDTNGINDAQWRDTVASKIRGAGYNVETLGIGPGYFASYDWSNKSKGKVGVYIMAASTVSVADAMSHNGFDYCIFVIRGDIPGTRAISGWNNVKWGKDSDCTSVCNKWAGHTSAEISSMMGDHGCLVPGNDINTGANNALAALNGNKVTPSSTSTNTSSNNSNTTVMDETATYQKALDEISKSIRSLLSFSIRVPLNSPIFKNLHTNMMFFTQLPTDFKLGNLEKIFKILPTYKVNRGVAYQENRWYVEGLKIKGDSNGVIADITLNAFPSSYSSYSNAVQDYATAYDQAFKQQTTSNGTSSSTSTGQARLGKDSTDTNSMRCMSGGYYGNAGTGKNFDSCSQKGYAQEGRSYYNWARQYNDPISLAKALANRFKYEGYSDNHDANAEVTHNKGGTIYCNCYDACRYVKCCFDAAGLDCVVITGNIYQGGHGWNAVKYNGSWYSFDLCYGSKAGDQKGTNALRKFF